MTNIMECYFSEEQSDILNKDMILDMIDAMIAYTNWEFKLICIEEHILGEATGFEHIVLVAYIEVLKSFIPSRAFSPIGHSPAKTLQAVAGGWLYANKFEDSAFHTFNFMVL